MIFTDRWFMSCLDATHIAASMGGGWPPPLPVAVHGVITYASALVAQYYGAGSTAKRPAGGQPGLLMATPAFPCCCYWYFGGKAFACLGHDPPRYRWSASISRC